MGKARGFLILFIFFAVVAVGVAVVGFVDVGRFWDKVQLLTNEAFPWGGEDQEETTTVSLGSSLEGAEFLTEAAMEALKEGKAKPGDILELGQMYMKASRDGQLDQQEARNMLDLADRAGIMDIVIDKALEPANDGSVASDGSVPLNRMGTGVGTELRILMAEVEMARADGNLNPGELMTLIQKARNSGLQERIQGMIPTGYDEARARTAARNFAKSMITGRANVQEVNTIVNLFVRAQADGRLDHGELDRIIDTAERLSL
ncbi:uncharacterized protein METZ01_LOCUS306329 [marine metagenome]|uniref:Uncharacterized protein n=1 Tax=marine metagenome TaxID=408172 RepID=A0A382MZF1_9ZZZZ